MNDAQTPKRKKSTKSTKSTKMLPPEVDAPNAALNQGASSSDKNNAVADAANVSPASAAQSKSKRKKSYATPPSTATRSERAIAASEPRVAAMLSHVDVVAGAEDAVTPIKRTNKKQSGQLIQDLKASAPTGDNNAAATAGLVKRVNGKLRKIKKTKLPVFTKPSEDDGEDNVSEVAETPQTSQERKGKKKTNLDMLNWNESARVGDRPLADAMQQHPSLDEDQPDESPAKHTTPKPQKERRITPTTKSTPARRYTRKSNGDTTILAADRELNNSRILSHPPVLLTSGKFTQDEDEILRRAILDYQQRNNLSTTDLVSIIHWSDRSSDVAQPHKKIEWDQVDIEAASESKEFWGEILHTKPLLKRKAEIIKRHVQARYHSFKSGGWTEEEDEQLKALMEKHPNQWKTMALIMSDRSAIDIHNRWKDYVQHGDHRNTSRWTIDEEKTLLEALTTVVQRDEDAREAGGLPPIAEYTNKNINWSEVSKLMGNARSRLQCTVKWTQLKQRDPTAIVRPVYRRGRTPGPNQHVEPTQLELDGGDNVIAVSKKRREESTDTPPEPQDRESVRSDGIDDSEKPLVTEGRTKRRRTLNKTKKTAQDIETQVQPNGEDIATPGSENNQQEVTTEEHDEATPAQHEEVLATPEMPESSMLEMSQQPQNCTRTHSGVVEMTWDEKFDLISTIAQCNLEPNDRINWPKLAEHLQNKWSGKELKRVYKELLGMVPKQESRAERITAVLEHIKGYVDEDKIKEYYDSLNAGEVGFADTTNVEQSGKIDMGLEASESMSKEKRKRDEYGTSSASRSQGKRRKKRSTLTRPSAVKSTPMVTESDNAEEAQGS